MSELKDRKSRALLVFAAAAAAAAAVAGPALSQRAGSTAALSKLQPGLWQLRVLGGDSARPAPVCLGDPTNLAQLQHRSSPCSRIVVGQDGEQATVHYTCPAGGYGQTILRVETPRLVQVDTQGIAGNVPFAYRAEARFIGSCSSGQHRSNR